MSKRLILIGLMGLALILLVACTQDYNSGTAYAQQYAAQGCGVT